MNKMESAIVVICLSPIWGAFIWEVWEGIIRPSRTGHMDVLAKADELWERDDEHAFDITCAEEYRAWHNCDSYELGRWRRIRAEVMRRERARGATFQKVHR